MTFDDLRAFVAAYEASSMSEAARRLGCTQGAVAQHVRRLEQELRAELFLRGRRGVAPTEQGTTLYRAACSSLSALELAAQEIALSRKRREEKLRLTTSTEIVNRYLREPMLALRERHPGVQIEIAPQHTVDGRLDALRGGRADIALLPLTDSLQSLETRPYKDVELVLLVHRSHPLAKRKQVSSAELGTIRYLTQSLSSGTYSHVAGALRAVGIPLLPVQIVEEAANATLLVELGRGETFVPAGLGRILERSHRVKAVRLPWLPPLQMVWAARSFGLLPDVAMEFLEICERTNAGTNVPRRAS